MKNLNFRIAMISDFFYPNVGGVEGHIFELSQCLIKLGHKVIVITHAYGENEGFCRQGVRYLKNYLKVYYIPLRPIYQQCTLPTLFLTLPIIRDILIRENIEIVHSHSAFSALAHEGIVHAKTLKLKTIFTDHSLFGFADLSSIIMNKLLQWTMVDVDRVICVSHTSKENTVIRANLNGAKSRKVFVIPNAVDSSQFTPDPQQIDNDFITVVVVSRLVYRKGVDLLIGIIPVLCEMYPNLRFLIGGDGPKRLGLEEIREKNNLYSRVILKGSLSPSQVRENLIMGDIFISTSLTEAFCIAIVEAASCGLKVVSTNVGGVCEVLPSDLIYLCDPSKDALITKMKEVIDLVIEERSLGKCVNQWEVHEKVKNLYTWDNVAKRTEKVYIEAMKEPVISDFERLGMHFSISAIGGKIFGFILLLEILFFKLLCFLKPAEDIEYFSNDGTSEKSTAQKQKLM